MMIDGTISFAAAAGKSKDCSTAVVVRSGQVCKTLTRFVWYSTGQQNDGMTRLPGHPPAIAHGPAHNNAGAADTRRSSP